MNKAKNIFFFLDENKAKNMKQQKMETNKATTINQILSTPPPTISAAHTNTVQEQNQKSTCSSSC